MLHATSTTIENPRIVLRSHHPSSLSKIEQKVTLPESHKANEYPETFTSFVDAIASALYLIELS